jgi:hypothetical protein
VHHLEVEARSGNPAAWRFELIFATDTYSGALDRVAPAVGGVDVDLDRECLAPGRAHLDYAATIRLTRPDG